MKIKRLVPAVVFLLLITCVHAIIEDRVLEKEGQIPIIITFKDNPLPPNQVMAFVGSQQNVKTTFVNTKNVHALEDREVVVKNSFSTINAVSATATKQVILDLQNHPQIASIEFDAQVFATLDSAIPVIGAPEIQNSKYNDEYLNGSGMGICVLDTGVDLSNPYLKTQGGHDFFNFDNDPSDDHGHGTQVSGAVASTHPTHRGVAPGAHIIPVKVLSSSGIGFYSDIIAGIEYCVNNRNTFNIKAISMSLGTNEVTNDTNDCDGLATANAIDNAVSQGLTVVVASGNAGQTNGIAYPACVSSAISAGATNDADQVASFSNAAPILDILAPGVSIESLDLGNTLSSHHGTSYSTPIVAGAVAILAQVDELEQNVSLNPTTIRNTLTSTGVPVQDSRNFITFPRVDVNASVRSLITLHLNQTNNTINQTINQTINNTLNNTINNTNQTNPNNDTNITLPSLNLTIISPKPIVYDSRRILLHVESESVGDLYYAINDDRFRRLCRNCFSFERSRSFKEGQNNLTIERRAINTTQAVVSFFVDSKRPRLSRVTPSRKDINGTFTIRYSEDNLQKVIFSFQTLNNSFQNEFTHCPSGRNQQCMIQTNLSPYHGQEIRFNVTLQDVINSFTSRTYEVMVDTTKPTVSLHSPLPGLQEQRRVTFNVSTDGKNKIEYQINDDRARRLCSRCDERITRRTLPSGNHTLTVSVTDAANNKNAVQIPIQVP